MLYFPNHGYGLHRVVYVSRSLIGEGSDADATVETIVSSSSRRNGARAVTGALVYYNGWFAQVLEGSRDAVKPIFDAITGDPRHTDIKLIAVDPAESRAFARWGMKRGSAPAGAAFDLSGASSEELLAILKLSTLKPAAKAA